MAGSERQAGLHPAGRKRIIPRDGSLRSNERAGQDKAEPRKNHDGAAPDGWVRSEPAGGSRNAEPGRRSACSSARQGQAAPGWSGARRAGWLGPGHRIEGAVDRGFGVGGFPDQTGLAVMYDGGHGADQPPESFDCPGFAGDVGVGV